MSLRKKIIKDFFNSPEMNREKWLRKGRTFHNEDIRFLKEIIPEKSNILELGCGNGHLLASLKPNYGLGIDFSKVETCSALNLYEMAHLGDFAVKPISCCISMSSTFITIPSISKGN